MAGVTPSTTGPTASMMEETAAHPHSPPERYTNRHFQCSPSCLPYLHRKKNIRFHHFNTICFSFNNNNRYNITNNFCPLCLKGGKVLFGSLQACILQSRWSLEAEAGFKARSFLFTVVEIRLFWPERCAATQETSPKQTNTDPCYFPLSPVNDRLFSLPHLYLKQQRRLVPSSFSTQMVNKQVFTTPCCYTLSHLSY